MDATVTELERLALAIEEDRRRKIEEVEEAYRKDLDALDVVKRLYEKYGDAGPIPPPEGPHSTTEPPVVRGETEPAEEVVAVEIPEETEPVSLPDPPDAGGSVEEEQRAEEPPPVEGVPEGFKLCKRCGPVLGPKPIAAFGRHTSFSDGRDNRCKDCRTEMRKLKKAGLPDTGPGASVPKDAEEATEPTADVNGDAPVASSGPPMRITVLRRTPEFEAEHQDLLEEVASGAPAKATPEARYCANGENCVAYKRLDEPTKLYPGKKGDVCYRCEETDTALGRRPVGTLGPIVRKPAAKKEGVAGA